jgi:hypothetical protein
VSGNQVLKRSTSPKISQKLLFCDTSSSENLNFAGFVYVTMPAQGTVL